MYGDFRYLDFGGISFVAGFVFLALNVFVEHLHKKRLFKVESE